MNIRVREQSIFCSIGIQEGKLCIMRERGRTESREQKRRKNCVAGTRRRGYFMCRGKGGEVGFNT